MTTFYIKIYLFQINDLSYMFLDDVYSCIYLLWEGNSLRFYNIHTTNFLLRFYLLFPG